MNTEHLRVSTEMLRRLGEELNPHPDQGILELIKNAYDADARVCSVELVNTSKPGGTILVSDDGCGMDAKGIRDGWLVVGSSTKPSQTHTPIFQRAPAGSKGLGRLAALRLGQVVSLTTCPTSEPDVEYSILIDWSKFDGVSVVEDVDLLIEKRERSSRGSPGTVIEISNISTALSPSDIKRLARAMILLADPFSGHGSFRPVLRVPEYEALEKAVRHQYFSEANFTLVAELSSNGHACATVRDYNKKAVFSAGHERLCRDPKKPVYKAPAATFELYVFLLGGKAGFTVRDVTLGEVKVWLKRFGGVHLYHRGLRVHPYSDYDWLDMNLTRTRNPELRPSTGTSIGRLLVADIENELIEKTDRTGFVEGEAFSDLKRFATDALEWMADERVGQREAQRGDEKRKAAEKLKRARKDVAKALASLPESSREVVKKAVEAFETTLTGEVNNLREELQLYRTLCTVGATSAAFAHQSKSPLAIIVRDARELENSVQDGAQRLTEVYLADISQNIRESADSVLSFAKVTLELLNHHKRRRCEVSVHRVIADVKRLLGPFLMLRKVDMPLDRLKAERCVLFTSPAALESIFTNLLINSLEAFQRAATTARKIEFRTQNTDDKLRIIVGDNGPGIEKLSIEEIWLPGKTTTENGTGLGLTIVRDVVLELDGTVNAVAHGALGGAEFQFEFPIS